MRNVEQSWPRRAHLQRYAFATDPSGALYVAASREVVGPHVLLKLVPEPGDGVRIAGFQIGRGALAAETIRADEPGIALPVRRFRRSPELVGYRYDELRPAPPSAIRRCF